MTPEKWQAIKELFGEAVEMPRAKHEAFLAERANGDDELRREVEKLLVSDEEAKTLFDGKTLLAPNKFVPEKIIGVYKIVRKIGEGGMGVVYLAERGFGNDFAAFSPRTGISCRARTSEYCASA